MTTVSSLVTGRTYEIDSQLYGTSNRMYRLSFGGIVLCSCCDSGNPLRTIEEGIEAADVRCKALGIKINSDE